MKLSRFSSVALAAAMLLPAASQAQATLQFDGVKTAGGDLVGSAATGAYRAHQIAPTVGTVFDIYCLDFDHTAQSVWNVRSITFADAVGIHSVAANRQLGTEKVWDIRHLRVAAYLSTQFTAAGLGGMVGPGAADDNWDGVHGAIWSMFSTNAAPNAHSALATGLLATIGMQTSWDAGYRMIVDERAWDSRIDASLLSQGFITEDGNVRGLAVVPEPSTYALLGAGLLAIGFARRRRRSV